MVMIKRIFRIGVRAVLWITLCPVLYILPRKKDLLVVIGRDGSFFTDNTKYFFLGASQGLAGRCKCIYISNRADVVSLINQSGPMALHYPSFRAVATMLRAGSFVVDVGEWGTRMRRFLLIGARSVQLWHGVPLKQIQRPDYRYKGQMATVVGIKSKIMLWLHVFLRHFSGLTLKYDLVVAPSSSYREEVFQWCFFYRYMEVFNYPRNSFGRNLGYIGEYLAWKSVDPAIARLLPSWVEEKRRIILLAPTYRDTRPTRMGLDGNMVSRLDEWCEKHAVEMVFKFHPWERGAQAITGNHLHVCTQDSDIYPVLPRVDMLITDLSSIYFDFLFMDKPIIFFVPDFHEYVRNDRPLFAAQDVDRLMPGPRMDTWDHLLDGIIGQFENDTYGIERNELRNEVFDDGDPMKATQKIIDFMAHKGWIASGWNE